MAIKCQIKIGSRQHDGLGIPICHHSSSSPEKCGPLFGAASAAIGTILLQAFKQGPIVGRGNRTGSAQLPGRRPASALPPLTKTERMC